MKVIKKDWHGQFIVASHHYIPSKVYHFFVNLKQDKGAK